MLLGAAEVRRGRVGGIAHGRYADPERHPATLTADASGTARSAAQVTAAADRGFGSLTLGIRLAPAPSVRDFSAALPTIVIASASAPPSTTRHTTDCRFTALHARVRDQAHRTPESGSGTAFPPSAPLFDSISQPRRRREFRGCRLNRCEFQHRSPGTVAHNVLARYATHFKVGPVGITHRSYRPPRYASGCCPRPAWTRRRYSSRSLCRSGTTSSDAHGRRSSSSAFRIPGDAAADRGFGSLTHAIWLGPAPSVRGLSAAQPSRVAASAFTAALLRSINDGLSLRVAARQSP